MMKKQCMVLLTSTILSIAAYADNKQTACYEISQVAADVMTIRQAGLSREDFAEYAKESLLESGSDDERIRRYELVVSFPDRDLLPLEPSEIQKHRRIDAFEAEAYFDCIRSDGKTKLVNTSNH